MYGRKETRSVLRGGQPSADQCEQTCKFCNKAFHTMIEFCRHEVSHQTLFQLAGTADLSASIFEAYVEEAEKLGNSQQPPEPTGKVTLGNDESKLSKADIDPRVQRAARGDYCNFP